MKQYILFDEYEQREKIGYFDEMSEVLYACHIRSLETDGECYMALYKYSYGRKYQRVFDFTYE